jgi:DNA-binding CsgD family transcriptional regulator/tetratricopeptide (TPR) repeat protein
MVTGKPVLLGRRSECELLDCLLGAARHGRGAVLVVRGEPGIGKTALLDYAVHRAQGLRVARVAGVESEMELAFAALRQLCEPMLGHLEALPSPQRDALATAFGLAAGHAPDRFMVGLATLSLLSQAGQQQPLLYIVDDAQWLDHASAQALAFVARRLLADAVAMAFGTREQNGEFAGLPELLITGLSIDDSRVLLDSVLAGRLDERVRDQIVAEAHGNPLALLELPRRSTPADLAGGFGMPDVPGVPGRLERSFRGRYEALPALTQRLLLVAAAEPTGDPLLVWEAAGKLGIEPDAAAAEADELVTFGARVVFRHPLVRSAVYRASSPRDRRVVHRAVADSIDAQLDPDRHAWHRAQATLGPDEDVARELESSAARAGARGGYGAAAAFLERSAFLTRDPARRAGRALAAAQAKQQAGAFDSALRLLAMAEGGSLTALQRAQVDLLRGRIAFAVNRGSDAPPFFVSAARQFQPLDAALARNTYLEALGAAVLAADLATGGRVTEVAHAVLAGPPPDESSAAAQLLLDGFALLISQGHAAGAPVLAKALTAFRKGALGDEDELDWLWLSCHAAGILWEDQTWYWLTTRFVELARQAGTLSTLPLALATKAASVLFCGQLGMAASLADEADALSEATGSKIAPYVRIALAAFYGREAQAVGTIEAARRDVVRRGEGAGLTIGHWAAALLYNGAGRYEDALAPARRAADASHEQFLRNWGLVELVEAAARSGRREAGIDALRRLTETVRASSTDWGLGVEARSKALLAAGRDAESLYQEAIERLERTRMRVDLARSCLAYGEWLRRERRRLDAREQLRRAHQLFTEFGMEAFAERARAELEATGGHARKRVSEARVDLTPQEAQISRLVADGATNVEIAGRLFISANTVDYHLRKTYRKLGVKSRTQLARRLRIDSPDA